MKRVRPVNGVGRKRGNFTCFLSRLYVKRPLGDQSLASAVNRESETEPLRHVCAVTWWE